MYLIISQSNLLESSLLESSPVAVSVAIAQYVSYCTPVHQCLEHAYKGTTHNSNTYIYDQVALFAYPPPQQHPGHQSYGVSFVSKSARPTCSVAAGQVLVLCCDN